jgi:hypothetical protein
LREALLDTNPATAFNPFGRSVNTPAALSRVLITLHDRGVATLTDESAALNGDLFKLPAEEEVLVLADCLQSLVSTFETIETAPAMTEAEDELSSGQC